MIEPLFNSFATAAFFQFVIFAIFEMRWMLLAWRARRTAQVKTAVVASGHGGQLAATLPVPECLAGSFGTGTTAEGESSATITQHAIRRATVMMQDGWQQQRELTLLYMRFYAVLLLGIMLTYQLQK